MTSCYGEIPKRGSPDCRSGPGALRPPGWNTVRWSQQLLSLNSNEIAIQQSVHTWKATGKVSAMPEAEGTSLSSPSSVYHRHKLGQ